MKQLRRALALTLALTCAAGTANAATIVIDFEGVNATYPSGHAFIEGFYDGGTSSDGTSGADFGVGFSANAQAICLNTPGVLCSNTSRGGLGNPESDKGGLFFLSGAETFMNVAAGFDTGFSFFYAAPYFAGSVSVYDGLNGTGNLLATLVLPTTSSSCGSEYSAGFCPFAASGIGFAGTAMSVSFAGVANQVVFDDVTFGSVTPGVPAIPEPETYALMLAGLGVVATVARRRKRTV